MLKAADVFHFFKNVNDSDNLVHGKVGTLVGDTHMGEVTITFKGIQLADFIAVPDGEVWAVYRSRPPTL